jgi:hypothetical protein
MDDRDDLQEDEWPNDDEANDVMLAYAATKHSHGSGSGCAGAVLILTLTTFALVWTLFMKL